MVQNRVIVLCVAQGGGKCYQIEGVLRAMPNPKRTFLVLTEAKLPNGMTADVVKIPEGRVLAVLQTKKTEATAADGKAADLATCPSDDEAEPE